MAHLDLSVDANPPARPVLNASCEEHGAILD
jgi:hypothetical protein